MISITAYAKINLFLKIKDLRPDGYHGIETIMQEISLHDSISLEKNSKGYIELKAIDSKTGEFDIPWNEDNLVFKAAKIFLDYVKIDNGLTISIKKSIPTSAGLGGGSSDAAATLIGVNRLWKTNLPKDRLIELAEKIGSDVPFFLYGKTALVTGKGEKVTPVKSLPKTWLVLVKPKLIVSSRWAYEIFDAECKISDDPDINAIISCLKEENKNGIYSFLYNDFERVIFNHYEELKNIRDTLIRLGAQNALLSGSGSVVFGVCDSESSADKIYSKLKLEKLGRVYKCYTL